MIDYYTLSTALLLFFSLLGIALLFLGGESLCKGAVALSLRLGINPIIIGLTVVSMATSLPELITSFYSAASGSSDIAVGNIVGSNIANIGLILGLCALVTPVAIHARLISKEVPILMGATLLFTIFCWFGTLSRWEGLVLLLAMVTYIIFLIKESKKEDPVVEEALTSEIEAVDHLPWLRILAYIALGTLLLHFGAEFLVNSASNLARRIGISESLIGLTLVAVGTSLPELAASLTAARKGHADICAGNVIGSNIFNLLFIGGSVSLAFPLTIDHSMLFLEFPAMFLMTALVWRFFVTDRLVSRKEGFLLIAVYAFIITISTLTRSF